MACVELNERGMWKEELGVQDERRVVMVFSFEAVESMGVESPEVIEEK